MQGLEENALKDQYTQNGIIGQNSNGRRFIECIRCGKQIKNDPRVIKNHEYYCKNKELASTNTTTDKPSPENEYADYKNKKDISAQENETVEPVSDKITNNSGSFSGMALMGIMVGIIGAVIIVYKILAQKKQSGSNITQTPMDIVDQTKQSPQIVHPWVYLFPMN